MLRTYLGYNESYFHPVAYYLTYVAVHLYKMQIIHCNQLHTQIVVVL